MTTRPNLLGPGAAPTRRLPRHRRGLHAITLAEGWLSVALLAIVVLAATGTVARTQATPEGASLAALALGGLLTGLALAKLGTLDLLAHLVAVLCALTCSVILTVTPVLVADDGRGWSALVNQGVAWPAGAQAGAALDAPRFQAIVLGAAAWLAAYTAAWALFRRGWLTIALALPVGIVLANLRYASNDEGALPLLATVAAGTLLAARHAAFRREVAWSRARLPYPQRMANRFLRGGIAIALLVGGLAWTVPHSAQRVLGSAASTRLDEPFSGLVARWSEAFARFGAQDAGRGDYATFGERFRLGGRLALSDDPVLLLRPGDGPMRPAYLAAQRYDAYDGRGWSTTVEETFRDAGPAGQRLAPRMSYASGQGVHLSPDVTTDRSQVEASLTVIRPKGNLLFTLDTYLTADRRTNVQLSWLQLTNQPYSLARRDLTLLPVDLRRLGVLLARGSYDPSLAGSANADSPLPRDSALAAEIQDERDDLSRRFLDVGWEVGSDGQAETLLVSGPLPVYDDVEAVFSQDRVAAGDSYRVTGLASAASPAQLRAAGADYPVWVIDRYLSLPDSVTQRTRQLAARLASGQSNPFDVAVAIEDFVRSTIAYNEETDAAPEAQDVVDYVLFESQEGYCVHYASAMAVLLRAEGIPARVVAGYYPAPFDLEEGGYLYREKNAHLWVEVYFPGFGWIPFEPTANRELLSYGVAGASKAGAATPAPVASAPAPTAVATPPPVAEAPAGQPPALEPVTLPGFGRIMAWLGLVAAGFVAAAAAVVAWLGAFRGLPSAAGFFARALRAGAWLGIRPSVSSTPREYADRFARELPAAREPIRVLAELYAQERYGRNPPSAASICTAREAWKTLRAIATTRALRRRGVERR
jgi:transglutaminase-like putative cysteine protease